MYIITAKRMTSGLVLKYRKGERWVIRRTYSGTPSISTNFLLTKPFQVVDVGKGRFAGAVRDTVHVPPMAMVTIAVDAGEAARWMLHCHHMAHLSTGMMTEFAVSA